MRRYNFPCKLYRTRFSHLRKMLRTRGICYSAHEHTTHRPERTEKMTVCTLVLQRSRCPNRPTSHRFPTFVTFKNHLSARWLRCDGEHRRRANAVPMSNGRTGDTSLSIYTYNMIMATIVPPIGNEIMTFASAFT